MIPFFLLTLLLVACGGDNENGETDEVVEIPGHTITGEIENAEGMDAVLVIFENQQERVLDSVKITNGQFKFQTETKELREYILLIGQQEMPIVLFLDENSENVTIKGSMPGVGDNYTVSGSEESQHIKDYLSFLMPYFPIEQSLYGEIQMAPPGDTVKVNEVMEQLDSISQIQRDYALNHFENHPNSPASWLMLRELFPPRGIQDFDTTDLKYFRQVAAGIREKYPYSEYATLIDNDVKSVEAQIAQMNNPELANGSGTAPFEYAPEINLADRGGQPLALSSLRGKVVLIDFWASWCGPCRQENPNVVDVYQRYKDKGFTVYSVSLDSDRDAWLRAIEADNLLWPNHVSDLNGWQSSAAVDYGVNSIPATFLIDAEGKVIATNLRGPALERKLQEVLG